MGILGILVFYHLHGQTGRFTVWVGLGKWLANFRIGKIPFGTGAYHLRKSLPFTKKLTNNDSARALFWYIPLPFCAQLQRGMTKFNVLCRTQTLDGEFSFL